jgi:hypothetical protein
MREIPVRDWSSTLERFSREHRAWLATVHRVRADAPIARVPLAPLDEAAWERARDCVRIAFLDGEALHVRRPRLLRVEHTDAGAEQALEIDTAEGELVRLAFRATALPEEVDGLAPGEVAAPQPVVD